MTLGLKCEGQAGQESRPPAQSARSPRHGLLQRLAAAIAGLHGRRVTQATVLRLRRSGYGAQATALAFKAATTYTYPAAWIDVNVLHRPNRAIARSDKPTHYRQLI